MRRLLLLVCFLVLAADHSAAQDWMRYYPPSSGSGSASFPLTGGTGCTAGNLPYGFTADSGAGMCLSSVNNLHFQVDPTDTTGFMDITAAHTQIGFKDAGSALTEVRTANNLITFFSDNTEVLSLDDTLGAGLIAGKASSGVAVARSIAAGAGISVSNGDGQSGNPTVGIDTAVVPLKGSDTSLPAACGDTGDPYQLNDFFLKTDTHVVYVCDDIDSFSPVNTTAAHATSHKSGGSDAIKLDELAATTDVTTLNSSASAHGLLPKLSGSSGDCFLGNGTFTACPGGGSGAFFFGGNADSTSLGTGVTSYMGVGALTLQTTEARRAWVVPAACTARDLYVTTGTAQGAGGSQTFTVRILESGLTTIVVTVAAGAGAGNFSNANTAAVTAGQHLSIEVTNNHTAGGATIQGWGMRCAF